MISLALILLLAQYPTGSITVRDEGTNLGKAIEVNCTGAGVTCTQSGWRWTLNIAGGGGSGLPADPSPCLSGRFVTDQDASGVLTCAQVAYADVSGTPADLSAVPFLTVVPSALLSAETVLPAACIGTAKLTWNGTSVTCGADIDTDTDTLAGIFPTDDTVLTGNGTVWQARPLTSCTGPNDVMRYQPVGNVWGCSSTMAQNGEPYLTSAVPSALSSYRRIVAGVSTSIDTTTLNQLAVDVVSPVATASALAADPANCAAGQAPLGVLASGAVEGCFTPAGTYSLPILTATVLGGVKGTGTATACSGSDKATGFSAAGALLCGADLTSGGAGGANFVAVTVTFPATGSDMVSTVVTGQAWVGASSSIVCSPTLAATGTRSEGDEDALIERLIGTVHTRVAATGFTLTVAPSVGAASGDFLFSCIGG